MNPRNERAGGALVDFQGRPHLGGIPVIHDDEPVTKGHGLHLIVGHVDAGDLELLVKVPDLESHLDPQLGIQVAQGFIEEKDPRFPHDTSSHGHPLALPAGQLAGLSIEVLGEFQDLRGVTDPPVDLIPGHTADFQPVRHVLVDRHVRVERVVLEDHGDIPRSGLQPIHHGSVDGDLACGDDFKPRDHPQQGRLAAPGRPQDHHELPVVNITADPVNDLDLSETLVHVPHAHVRHGPAPYFSVSVIPLTNCFCMKITTSTGGIMASMADAMIMCHSAWPSPTSSIRLIPMSTV